MRKTEDNSHEKGEMKKGPWTREEDQKLLSYIEQNGHGSWRSLPAKAGLQRCGKSCRLRWTNYLRPDIKRGKFSTHEEKTIIRLHALLGNRWSAIATHLPKRTDNEIKNYWNTRLKKRLTRMGIDPTTHKPKNNPSGAAHSRQAANLSHMAQWETARLEAEARLVRQSKRLSNFIFLHKLTAPPPPPPPQPAAPPCLDVLKVWQATSTRNDFFGSAGTLDSPAGTLDSPTSTLSFSGNCHTIPAVRVNGSSSLLANDVISGCTEYGMLENSNSFIQEQKGKMDNPVQLHHDNNTNINIGYQMDYDYNMMGSMDLISVNYNSDAYDEVNAIVGDLEENRNYWNDILNLVSTPLEPSLF